MKEELSKEEPAKAPPKPRQVVVQAEESTTFWPLPLATAPMLERLAGGGLVIVLVVFMLIQRENLRNRLIRLVGYGRLTITTKALEEAGQRISRYLLMQSIINASFGIAVGIALYLIGLPYALLWGFWLPCCALFLRRPGGGGDPTERAWHGRFSRLDMAHPGHRGHHRFRAHQ